jgi:indole-3-glycerol phosphate synthase
MRPDRASGLLGAILASTRKTVQARRERRPLDRVLADAAARSPNGRLMVERLARQPSLTVIAECKRRSPTRGLLRPDYDAGALAERYEANGAAAISVLTEPAFFDGSLGDLAAVRARVGLPVLRKDFIVDEYQLVEARAAGADAVLLIVAAVDDSKLRSLYDFATELGLASLVEVHSRSELDRALELAPRMIGVNNRDLTTLEVDPTVSLQLVGSIPDGTVSVAESGLSRCEDLRRLRESGYDAFLVGEHLVSAPDPGLALRELLKCS